MHRWTIAAHEPGRTLIITMRFGARVTLDRLRLGSSRDDASADIELMLVSAAADALPSDYRVLGILAAWLDVHRARVNVPRLLRFATKLSERPIERAWWSAVGQWLGGVDARWRTLASLYKGPQLPLDDAGVDRAAGPAAW